MNQVHRPRYFAVDSPWSDRPFLERHWQAVGAASWARARVSSWWMRPTCPSRRCTRWAWPGRTVVGRLGDFLDGVAALGLGYVAEVPVDTRVWPERPLTVVPRTRHVLAGLGWKWHHGWTAQCCHYRRCTQPADLPP